MKYTKQQGFTLLELLVVITLLAVLSVGALVAYEGIGENASNVATANNIKTADSAIRAYRAIENVYPNQWDNLANLEATLSGGAVDQLSNVTKEFFGQWSVDPTNAVAQKALVALANVGVSEFQTLTSAATRPAGVAPNEFWNESAPGVATPADELEIDADNGEFEAVEYAGAPQTTAFGLSIVPSGGAAGTCTAGSTLASNFEGEAETAVPGLGASTKLNRINDALDSDGCHLVVAVGFGKDVPGTTLGSRVAISTAPTYTNGNIVNPSVNYARYIALFHLGSDDEDNANNAVDENEVFDKARLIAVVDTEGRTIDQSIAGAFASN